MPASRWNDVWLLGHHSCGLPVVEIIPHPDNSQGHAQSADMAIDARLIRRRNAESIGRRLTIPDASQSGVFELRKEIPTIPAASEEIMKVQEMAGTVVKVHEIPGTLVVEWNEDAKAMIDTWSSYIITVPQFREAILGKGMSYAKAHGGRAWVMDGTKAQGAMSKDVQSLIEAEVFKAFAAIGIKYFVTIKSTESALANSAIKRFVSHLGPSGIQMVEVPNQRKAIEWLKEHP
jgi:hypothetical protein